MKKLPSFGAGKGKNQTRKIGEIKFGSLCTHLFKFRWLQIETAGRGIC